MKHSSRLRPRQAQLLRAQIHDIQDFPVPGVLFRNVLPILADPDTFEIALAALCAPYEPYEEVDIDAVVGIASRGYLFGMPMAQRLNVPFYPVAKAGELPGLVDECTYQLEYGGATLAMQRGVIKKKGARVVVVDDLLATGGTAQAAATLVHEQGGNVFSFAFIVEVASLSGRGRLFREGAGAVINSLLIL